MELKPDKKQSYYINTFEDKLSTFKEYLEKKDFVSLKNLGHKLKGSGKAFGFEVISEIGRAIEKYAVNKDLNLLEKEFDNLKKVFNKIRTNYGL